ncbi:MAG: cell envelope integrity protein TolA [Vulcanimicrobiaceae bacterium]
MGIANIAVVFAPCIIRSSSTDPKNEILYVTQAQTMVVNLLENLPLENSQSRPHSASEPLKRNNLDDSTDFKTSRTIDDTVLQSKVKQIDTQLEDIQKDEMNIIQDVKELVQDPKRLSEDLRKAIEKATKKDPSENSTLDQLNLKLGQLHYCIKHTSQLGIVKNGLVTEIQRIQHTKLSSENKKEEEQFKEIQEQIKEGKVDTKEEETKLEEYIKLKKEAAEAEVISEMDNLKATKLRAMKFEIQKKKLDEEQKWKLELEQKKNAELVILNQELQKQREEADSKLLTEIETMFRKKLQVKKEVDSLQTQVDFLEQSRNSCRSTSNSTAGVGKKENGYGGSGSN